MNIAAPSVHKNNLGRRAHGRAQSLAAAHGRGDAALHAARLPAGLSLTALEIAEMRHRCDGDSERELLNISAYSSHARVSECCTIVNLRCTNVVQSYMYVS